ncbi:unnamed protein product [Rhizoctonia solani]|uniref:Protein kinase domain-containing protein n=1 Tax=Rhizoctonia solani TaxID=456999 RepID=A0A8H2WN79_9AGAM|nr:unnamed protein product [Rhizoctonia solani]
MPSRKVVAILKTHGCRDLTASLDKASISKYPVATGGLGDVYSGKLLNATPVAIKTIRTYYDGSGVVQLYHKRAAREIYTWSQCKHANVVELLGLAVFRDSLAMISRLEENSNMPSFLSKHPSTDRCEMSTYICAGLAYLHDNGITHGDLKGANILIASDGRPMLMDFGNATFIGADLHFTETTTGLKSSPRWTAPEILEGKSKHSIAGDVYSLGMTILEAHTSIIPFPDHSHISLIMHVVVRKNTPTRPQNIIPSGRVYCDQLWAMLMKCWSYDPEHRPNAKEVWEAASICYLMQPLTPEKLNEINGDHEVGAV